MEKIKIKIAIWNFSKPRR